MILIPNSVIVKELTVNTLLKEQDEENQEEQVIGVAAQSKSNKEFKVITQYTLVNVSILI